MRREILPGISHGGCYTGFTKPATEPPHQNQRSRSSESATGRRAKFYTLTKAGSKQLKAEEESWDRLALAIAKVRRAV
jgi:hypothetical protein